MLAWGQTGHQYIGVNASRKHSNVSCLNKFLLLLDNEIVNVSDPL